MFTLEELAAYPGAEGIPEATALLLRDLAQGLVDEIVPPEVSSQSIKAKGIALEVVARAYRNPNGYQSENVDDYGYRRPAATSASGVYLTADEAGKLASLVTGAPSSRVRSVRMRSASQR